jgi:hypothetical protein
LDNILVNQQQQQQQRRRQSVAASICSIHEFSEEENCTEDHEETDIDIEMSEENQTRARHSMQEEKQSSKDDEILEPGFVCDQDRIQGLATMIPNRRQELVKKASISIYHGEGFEVGHKEAFDMYSPENNYQEHYDPWIYADMDEDGHKRENIHILGTSHDDMTCQPHVLSPILMQSLQEHLPYSKRGQSLWLKYSLVRDGASNIGFLQRLRGSQYTLMAMETVDGEVFGAFCTQPWTIQPRYFGTGESFLWRMKHSRILENGEQYHNGSLAEQAQREAAIEVFPAVNYGGNGFFQLCQHDKIAVGGGVCDSPQDFGKGEKPDIYHPERIGFGLVFDDASLMYGSSSACLTFQSPPLSKHHSDGSKFELVNLEVWGLTPCLTVEEAQIMECKHLFLKRHATM